MRKKIKRLHSEDARFLRSLFFDVIARLNEVELAVGELQRRLKPAADVDDASGVVDV